MFSRLKWLYHSSSLRLVATLALVFIVLLALVWVVTREVLAEALFSRAETELSFQMDRLQENDRLSQGSGLYGTLYTDGSGGIWGIRKGEQVWGYMPPEFSTQTGMIEFEIGDATYLGLIRYENGIHYLVALETEEIEYAGAVLDFVFLFCVLTSLVITLLVGAILGIRAQKRIDQISDILSQISLGNLEARLAENPRRDDLGRIAMNINSTTDKLQKLVEQTRNAGNHIAHDLRTPLTKLKVHVEAIRGEKNQTTKLVLNREISRMKELINAILRLAQIEAQQSPSNFSPIDLNAFAREIYDTFSVVVEDQGKRLSLRVDDARVVNGEVALLNQAVANLIQNAINYGGDEISLFVEGASIGLADNGVGVPPGEFENIIRPMVRLDFAQQREGSGLGLALVNAVAKLHGAKLVLDANQPSGLVVRLVFSSK